MAIGNRQVKKDDYDVQKAVSNEGGLLSKLFRTIVKDEGRAHQIPMLIEKYQQRIARENMNKTMASYSKVQSKSQMINNAKSDSMTFRVFIGLLRNIFCIRAIRMTIELEWPDGKVTHHSVESNLMTLRNPDEKDEKEDKQKDE